MPRIFSKFIIGIMSLVILLTSMSAYARTRTYDTDVVVVGAGSAGISSAVSAAENGAKVILLEKQGVIGGASSFAEGLFAVQTPQTKLMYNFMTEEEVFMHLMEYSHWNADPFLLKTFIYESPKTIAWLEGHGVKFTVIAQSPVEPYVWHLPEDKDGNRLVKALLGVMEKKAKKLGVKILTETTGKTLIIKNGEVAGVEAVDARGNKIIINAKAVITATGGFPSNKELIRKYTKFDPDLIHQSVPLEKNGEGLMMALQVGADVGHFGIMENPSLPSSNGATGARSLFAMMRQPNVYVNKLGQRFMPETLPFRFSEHANALYNQPGAFGWVIFDDSALDRAENEGTEFGAGGYAGPGPLPTVRADLKREAARDPENVAMGATPEELAKKIGLNPAIFKKTISDYNKYCEFGYDKEFHKDPQFLRPLKGKLYALKVGTYYFTTYGGAKVTPKMEVRDKDGLPIKGLYATGNDVGGLYGDTYTTWSTGIAQGFAWTSGHIAGINAAKLAK